MINCSHCHTEIDEQATTCPGCGKPLGAHQDTVACPQCGADNKADDYFCRKCGAILVYRKPTGRLPWSQEVYSEADETSKQHTKGPYVVISPNGAIVSLPHVGQTNLGREDPISGIYPDVNLEPFGAEKYGVSRLHARFTLEEDQVFIEDLGSLNSTFVNRRLLKPHVQYQLYDGDEIQLGGLTLTFHFGS